MNQPETTAVARCAAMVQVQSGVYEGKWFLGWKRQCSRRATSGEWCRVHAGFTEPVRFDANKHQFAPGMYISQREALDA